MPLLVQVTPEEVLDLNAITTAGHYPSEIPNASNTTVLKLSMSNGKEIRYYGATAAKLWKLILERSAPMEAL